MASTLNHDRLWDDAEATIVELERASRHADVNASGYFVVVVDRLATLAAASPVALSLIGSVDSRCLAKTNSPSNDASFGDIQSIFPSDITATHTAPWVYHGDANRLAVIQQIRPGQWVAIVIDWCEPLRDDPESRLTISDAVKAVIEFVSPVVLRQQLALADHDIASLRLREQSIAMLYQGRKWSESAHHIAQGIANHRHADRVLIATIGQSRCRLIASNAAPTIDRRERLASLLEELLLSVNDAQEPIRFTVGAASPQPKINRPELLDQYVIESGCRQIEINVIRQCDDGIIQPIAMTVVEWFRIPESAGDQAIDSHIERAVQSALARDTDLWGSLGRRFGDQVQHRAARLVIIGLAVAALALWLVPARLVIHAEGRVVPAVQRRLFSPADAVVTEISVTSGDKVTVGQTLLRLRSPAIDLQEENLRGAVLTAKTRLAALLASRSNNSREPGQRGDVNQTATSEESLKVEIEGLEKQLALVAQQQRELEIVSPIAGVVDRWDMRQTLAQRPVSQGQYLVDVFKPAGNWIAELDMPDSATGYLGKPSETTVAFRLQSQPDQYYATVSTTVAEAAHVDSQGRSLVRLRSQFVPSLDRRPTIGATVWGEIDCGNRSLGFVLFRGLFEWWNRQSWF